VVSGGVWPVGLGLHFTGGGCCHFGEIRVSEVVGCKVSLNSAWWDWSMGSLYSSFASSWVLVGSKVLWGVG
jgi:hypothetical protein